MEKLRRVPGFFASVALVAAFNGVTSPAPAVAPPLGAALDREVFDFLTESDWRSENAYARADSALFPFGPDIHYLCFLRRGVLRRWAWTDAPLYDFKGTWNFQMRSDSAGIITFAGSDAGSVGRAARQGVEGVLRLTMPPSLPGAPTSALWFERRGDRLWFAGRLYRAFPRSGVIDWDDGLPENDASRTREQLGVFVLPAAMSELTRGPWRTQDEFNLFARPDSLAFRSNMTCRARFQGGRCVQEGRFSLDGNSVLLEMTGPGCDERGGSTWEGGFLGYAVDHDTLLLDRQFFVRNDDRSGRRRALLQGYEGDWLIVEYRGDLRRDRSTALFLTFVNQGSFPVRLQALRIRDLGPVEPRKGSLTHLAAPRDLISRDYKEVEIPVGGSLRDTIRVTPTRAGERVALMFEWDRVDRTQDYHSKSYCVVPIR